MTMEQNITDPNIGVLGSAKQLANVPNPDS
jgi:hypothetical protein